VFHGCTPRFRPTYFVFYTVATRSGELLFTWKDDQGGVATHLAQIEVTE
jgi:hypothetical protein